MNQEYILEMDDLSTLETLETLIKSKRGQVFRKPSADEGIVFIVSGGLDSTITLSRVLDEFDAQIYPLYVKRGARNEVNELKSLDHYLNEFAKKYPQLHSLEILETEVPPKKYKTNIPEKQLSTIGHSMRNSMLQSFAVQYAVSTSYRDNISIKTVFSSLSPNDDLPHCRLVALRAETVMACIDSRDWSWQVTSPLLEPELWGWVDKSMSIDYAFRHGIDLSHTYTCTDSDTFSCGVCPACIERLQAFEKNGRKDPVPYLEKTKE